MDIETHHQPAPKCSQNSRFFIFRIGVSINTNDICGVSLKANFWLPRNKVLISNPLFRSETIWTFVLEVSPSWESQVYYQSPPPLKTETRTTRWLDCKRKTTALRPGILIQCLAFGTHHLFLRFCIGIQFKITIWGLVGANFIEFVCWDSVSWSPWSTLTLLCCVFASK